MSDPDHLNSIDPPLAYGMEGDLVRASSDAHTSPRGNVTDPASDEMDIEAVRQEIFGSRTDDDIPGGPFPSNPTYRLVNVDPQELVVPLEDQRDGALLSAVVSSLDDVGIIIPPVVTTEPNGRMHVLLGHGRTRVLWARDRNLERIEVLEVKCNGTSIWKVVREAAIEDIKKTIGYERLIEWIRYFQKKIDSIHKNELARRKLIANAKRSRTMLAKNNGQNDNGHKQNEDPEGAWQNRKFYDAVDMHRGSDLSLANSSRFKYPLTVSLFFREAISESTAGRVLLFMKALDSKDQPIRNLDVPKRMLALSEGEYSAEGIERRIRKTQNVEAMKKHIRKAPPLNRRDEELVIKWIFERIRFTNQWSWNGVNAAFGAHRRLAEWIRHVQRKQEMTKEEARKYVFGESIGADVPLNLMTYLTKPGQLILDPFSCSGATGDAANHFLDPRWRGPDGNWVWWNNWRDLERNPDSIFPADYWTTDHRRKALQFDISPNPVALEQFGEDFILQHDATEGVTPRIEQLVFDASSEGVALVYMDPPYLSQARYEKSSNTSGNDLSSMSIPDYVEAMSMIILAYDRILARDGRLTLLMGTDTRWGHYFDPAMEIFRSIQNRFDRIDQIPFELDRGGPIHERVWVPTHAFSLAQQIARRRCDGGLVNVQRNLWILRRRDKGSTDPLVGL